MLFDAMAAPQCCSAVGLKCPVMNGRAARDGQRQLDKTELPHHTSFRSID